jgi:hypothetical protein
MPQNPSLEALLIILAATSDSLEEDFNAIQIFRPFVTASDLERVAAILQAYAQDMRSKS